MRVWACLMLCSAVACAQPQLFVNGQLHRDFKREVFTSTVEVWNGDKLGSTFFFADFDFGDSGEQGSYFEVARHFVVKRTKSVDWNISVQFNDGVTPLDGEFGKQIPRTLLGGLALTEVRLGGATLEVQALARQEFAADIGWQLTGVWFWPIRKSNLEFLGYVDWNSNNYGDHPTSLQAEPQLQYRWKQVAIGTEWEISRNFAGAWTPDDGFEYMQWYVLPTVYLRYDLP